MLAPLLLLAGCASNSHPPMPTVANVDLERFMGDWYVIANIPTFVEKGAHNAIESYRLNPDGTVQTTFTFRKDGFNGETRTYHPTGFVVPATGNAVWGMQFFWPIKADYRIVYLTPSYDQTVIGRNDRDYVWIMARTPSVADADYAAILEHLKRLGYDVSAIQKVPQSWEARQP
ncbi:MAG: lipocalin family protein [Thiobacillaceae bacterium]